MAEILVPYVSEGPLHGILLVHISETASQGCVPLASILSIQRSAFLVLLVPVSAEESRMTFNPFLASFTRVVLSSLETGK